MAAEAALPRADTASDVVVAALSQLVGKLGVGDARPGHGHHVGVAFGDDLLRLGGVDDASDNEHRDSVGLLLDPGGVGNQWAERRPDTGQRPFCAPRAHVEEVDHAGGFEGLGVVDGVLEVPPLAARRGPERVHADPSDVVGADLFAHGADHLKRKPHAVFQRAAVLVFSLVVGGGKEFGEEVAVRRLYLDTGEAGALHIARRFREARDDVFDVPDFHFSTGLAAGIRVDEDSRRGSHDRLPVVGPAGADATVVIHLHEAHGAGVQDGSWQCGYKAR